MQISLLTLAIIILLGSVCIGTVCVSILTSITQCNSVEFILKDK